MRLTGKKLMWVIGENLVAGAFLRDLAKNLPWDDIIVLRHRPTIAIWAPHLVDFCWLWSFVSERRHGRPYFRRGSRRHWRHWRNFTKSFSSQYTRIFRPVSLFMQTAVIHINKMFSCKPTILEMQCNISGWANWHCEKWEVGMTGTYILYYLV